MKNAKTKLGILRTLLALMIAMGVVHTCCATDGEWIQLFNGKDINDWIVKLNHHELNDNYRDTFRVEDGILKVRYDQYEDFGERYGHLYYKMPFSHYHLAVEYRFVGELHRGAPGYAILNSGVMLHSQDPKTILRDQNWPISIELQFLAGLPNGKPRATGNVCTPGTHVFHNGKLTEAHIVKSMPEPTSRGNGCVPKRLSAVTAASSISSTERRCWSTRNPKSAAESLPAIIPTCSLKARH